MSEMFSPPALSSPTTCSAVLVGDHSQQLHDIPHLLDSVNNLVRDLVKPPVAIFLFLDKPLENTHIQHQSDLPIVRHSTIRIRLVDRIPKNGCYCFGGFFNSKVLFLFPEDLQSYGLSTIQRSLSYNLYLSVQRVNQIKSLFADIFISPPPQLHYHYFLPSSPSLL